jgi:hypothetical protein
MIFSRYRRTFSSHQLKVCHPLSVDAIGLLDVEREAAAPALEKLAVPTVEMRVKLLAREATKLCRLITIYYLPMHHARK